MYMYRSAFWPESEDRPVRRFVLAFAITPLVLAAALSLLALLIAGMSEASLNGVIDVTLNAAKALVPLAFVFMWTFGALGILVLWLLGQRGPVAWAVCGGLIGAIACALTGKVLLGRVEFPMLIASGFAGWAMFLLFRRIARIRDA